MASCPGSPRRRGEVEPDGEAAQLMATVRGASCPSPDPAESPLRSSSPAAPSADAKSSESPVRFLWTIRKITILTFFSGIYTQIDGDIMIPYLYTRVRCCPPSLSGKYNISAADARDYYNNSVFFYNGSTLVLPPDFDGKLPACGDPSDSQRGLPRLDKASDMWGHSEHCENFPYVQDASQRVIAGYTPLKICIQVLFLPTAGALSDCHGRRPVLLMGICGVVLGMAFFFFDTLISSRADYWLYLSALVMSTQAWSVPVGLAYIADIVPAERRAAVYPVWSGFTALGPLVGYVVSFVCLRLYLTDYRDFWMALSAVGVGLCVYCITVLPESLPKHLRAASLDWGKANPLRHYASGWALFRRDSVMFGVMALVFWLMFGLFGFLSIVFNFLVGSLNFKQENAVLPNIVGQVSQFAFSVLNAVVMPRWGPWNSFTFGLFVLAAGLLTYGAGSILLLDYAGEQWGRAAPFVAQALCSGGAGFAVPAYMTIASCRIPEDEQAKAQSIIVLSGALGLAAGTAFFSLIYDSTHRGWTSAVPALIGAGVLFCCSLGSWSLGQHAALTPPPEPLPRWPPRKHKTGLCKHGALPECCLRCHPGLMRRNAQAAAARMARCSVTAGVTAMHAPIDGAPAPHGSQRPESERLQPRQSAAPPSYDAARVDGAEERPAPEALELPLAKEGAGRPPRQDPQP
eukprot:TRINITY_DN55106_c0_g1_i1.p1 TRINITY_DN55106_c0_g1~~TRINITY_DN55106_c0_g1_i1.p1  ORF type:complete len:721 (+),score=218.34 TRINITY_DN55106_c0_g1_i1:103-2163(+)